LDTLKWSQPLSGRRDKLCYRVRLFGEKEDTFKVLEFYLIKKTLLNAPEYIKGSGKQFGEYKLAFEVEELIDLGPPSASDSVVQYRVSLVEKNRPKRIRNSEVPGMTLEPSQVELTVDSVGMHLLDEGGILYSKVSVDTTAKGKRRHAGILTLPWEVDKVVVVFHTALRDRQSGAVVARDKLAHPLLLLNTRMMKQLEDQVHAM
jgi:hypothetical protein